MNQLLKYTLLLFLVTFAACSSEDDAAPTVPNGQPQPGDALELTVSTVHFVTDGAPDTRATDNDEKTTFKDGDRVGIIILDENSHPIYDNIPYVYKSGKWTFDSGNDEGKGGCYYDSKAVTYIVYYPYSRAADKVTSLDDLKTKLAPKFNQSDIEDYRSSDLMVCSPSPLTSSKKELDAVLKHAFASVSLTPTAYTLEDGNSTKGNAKVSDVSLTIGDNVYVPYQTTDGSLRCIVPAGINSSSGIRCFYTFSGKTYGNTINIEGAANTHYTSAPEITNDTYTLANAKVGDFYCKDSNKKGYLIPSDVILTDEQKNACIGIVYCTDLDRIGKAAKDELKKNGVTSPHGLVMALTNASNACRWGKMKTDENGNNGGTDPFQHNTYTIKVMYNNVDGYAETHWIINTYINSGTTLEKTYSAFYHASRYGTEDGGTSQYAAPSNTTGWFIPSMGQWWDILSNLGKIDLSNYQMNEIDYELSISDAATTAFNNMNTYLEKISDEIKFSDDTSFWSSSECTDRYACCVVLYRALELSYGYKDSSGFSVRCVFAF